MFKNMFKRSNSISLNFIHRKFPFPETPATPPTLSDKSSDSALDLDLTEGDLEEEPKGQGPDRLDLTSTTPDTSRVDSDLESSEEAMKVKSKTSKVSSRGECVYLLPS